MGAVETGVLTSLQPGESQMLSHTDAHGNATIVEIPAGAVTEPVEMSFSPLISVMPPDGFAFIQHAFELSVYQDGLLLPGYAFLEPVTVIIRYAQEELGWADEDQLLLMLFSEQVWSDAALTCVPPSPYDNDPENNVVSLPVCHLSLFGAFGPTRSAFHMYLPLVER